MTNIEFAESLEQVAAFYRQHADAPLPFPRLHVFANSRDEFIAGARALSRGGSVEKRADPMENSWPQYHAIRSFGSVAVDMQIDRKSVCRLVRPAEYECPDSLLAEESAEFTAA